MKEAGHEHRGLGQDWRRVGGVQVETNEQRAALELMAPTLGAAQSRAQRIDKILAMLAQEVDAGATEITGYNNDSKVRATRAQLDSLSGVRIRRGTDLKYLVLQRLARLLNCSDTAALEDARTLRNQEIAHIVDHARGIAMNALAMHGARNTAQFQTITTFDQAGIGMQYTGSRRG